MIPATTKNEIQLITMLSVEFHIKKRHPSYAPKNNLHFFRKISKAWNASLRECKVDLKDAKKTDEYEKY